jgi:hypothetical protein
MRRNNRKAGVPTFKCTAPRPGFRLGMLAWGDCNTVSVQLTVEGIQFIIGRTATGIFSARKCLVLLDSSDTAMRY